MSQVHVRPSILNVLLPLEYACIINAKDREVQNENKQGNNII